MNLKINGSKFMTMYLQPEEREQQHMCLLVFQTNLQTQKKSSCILNLTQLIMIFNDFTAACISQKKNSERTSIHVGVRLPIIMCHAQTLQYLIHNKNNYENNNNHDDDDDNDTLSRIARTRR